ncbi:hypothetical protein TKV_c02250 [Thermoanaerobacter kivui]|uniref:Trehalose synthase-fused maltokinase n=1 Tax=Thermoanaerobacter kivui TaxID=2325 RepID=A0A097ANP2_THEKI|nr:hypothetical protein [Thermoanaerobacter kivui]AIS51430.1 hypothetical protein TKV_c02250 [Thermoanaerobacter kivui]
MYIDENLKFEDIPSKLESIVKSMDDETLKKFRWFQEKAYTILEKYLFDYAILLQYEAKIIIAAIIAFVVKDPNTKKESTSLYYLPLIITKYLTNNDLISIIEGLNFKAFVYDGVDDIEYVKLLNKILREEGRIPFKSDAKLIAVRLKQEDIYKSRRLSNKSSNSLTFLQKDEIIKTYRKLVKGINPDLEMTLELRRMGFENVQDIRGYFLYQDKEGKKHTVAIVVEYIKNMGDMWQYTQDYLASLISRLSGCEDIDEGYVKSYCSDYIEEVKNIAGIIADMHIKLSQIDEEDFGKRDANTSDIQDLLKSIRSNFYRLLSFMKSGNFEEPIDSMIKEIVLQQDFLTAKLQEFENSSVFGKYMRCHGDLHLEQILKTENGYVIIDFEGEPTKPIEIRKKKISPLKDVAGMVRSFSYAACAAYFNYLQQSGTLENERIERLLSFWAEVVTQNFIESYVNLVRKEAPDIIPEDESFDAALALFKLDKALFEGLYEVNNRPLWFKIPLKGILECIKDLKF